MNVGNQGVPRQFNPLLLELGRTVYANLQSARQAVLNKNAELLRADLQGARETLRRLQMPAQMIALDAQLTVIRNDLKDRSKALDADLWVPIEAEINDVLVYVPDNLKAGTRQAVHKARTAARRGDRAGVSKQLDVVTSSLKYSLVMFPLHKVWQDVQTASHSASLPLPDWTAALEAIQSAMASIHWYTQVPIHGLLAAYNAVINAYALEISPHFRPGQKQLVMDYLSQAERELSASAGAQQPGTEQLRGEVRALIKQASFDKTVPRQRNIRLLLNDIQSQIHNLWQQAERSYWKTIQIVE
jgi:hypothetical protein